MEALSLDQFLVFTTIADEGSFSAAARKLGRAQSAVTYAMHKLEDQTGTLLFDRSTYRPTLTEAGRALLPQARRVLSRLADFQRTARTFTEGLEAEVHLAVNTFVPMQPIYEVLGEFAKRFPDTAVRLHSNITRHETYLEEYPSGLAFVMNRSVFDSKLEKNLVGTIQLVAVAAPTHPLAKLTEQISPDLLASYFQIVLDGQHFLRGDRNSGVFAARRWYTDSLDIKRGLIRCGNGWGSLPWHMAADDIANGLLVELSPERWDGADHMPWFSYLLTRNPLAPIGPAGAWLFEQLSTKSWPEKPKTSSLMMP